MKNFAILDGVLHVNRIPVNLEFPVKSFIDLGNSLVVLLDVPNHQRFNENIFCVDQEGNMVWQVKKVSNVTKGDNQPYTYIDFLADGKRIIAGDSLGVDYYLNEETGEPEFAGVSK